MAIQLARKFFIEAFPRPSVPSVPSVPASPFFFEDERDVLDPDFDALELASFLAAASWSVVGESEEG